MQIKSKLLKQLDKEIAAAPGQVQSACSRARRAMLLARHGDLVRARDELTVLHKMAFTSPHPEIAAWLHCAEGLMSYYTDFGGGAVEKIRRAHALASSVGLPEVQAVADAWLAQLAYVRHDLTELVQRGRACLAEAAPDHHVARSRVCMVIGLAFHHCGAEPEAQPWYRQSRWHAATAGDDAGLSALMHNMAELRTAVVRRHSLSQQPLPTGELLLGADSVLHFDDMVGMRAMNELTPLLRAQILCLQCQYEAAAGLYEEHLPVALAKGLERLGSSLLSDLAWCRVHLGRQAEARAQALEAELELDPACELDDRAITHSRLAQVFEAVGEAPRARHHAQEAQQCWAALAADQAQWLAALRAADWSPEPQRTGMVEA